MENKKRATIREAGQLERIVVAISVAADIVTIIAAIYAIIA